MSDETDAETMAALLDDWFELRDWAANLLSTQFGFEDSREILRPPNRGNKSIPGTEWRYRTHGIGVEVYQEGGRAVDFDFASDSAGFKMPDPWRLRWFAEAEIRAGRPLANAYRTILSDKGRFEVIADEAISAHEQTQG